MDDHDTILFQLDRINNAWLKGPPDKITGAITDCFHQDAVIKGPDMKTLARGREACAKSYEQFVRQAKVRNFASSRPEVHIGAGTAVAVYSWELAYELEDKSYEESGHDLFVFTRSADGWVVLWRALLPATSA